MRLMNLIGKKIGLLIEEKDLEDRLKSLCKSKKWTNLHEYIDNMDRRY